MFGCLDAWMLGGQHSRLDAWLLGWRTTQQILKQTGRGGRRWVRRQSLACWKNQQEIHQVFESLSNMFEHPLTLPRECSRYFPRNCIRCSSSTILIRKCIKFYSEAAVNQGSSTLWRAKKKGDASFVSLLAWAWPAARESLGSVK